MAPAVAYSKSELLAIEIAWDELRSYIETVGDEASLDDDEMPWGKLRWAERKLREILRQHGIEVPTH